MNSKNTEVYFPEVYAADTNVGCVREHNEDSFVAASPLFVVADGMGGHEAGEVASEIAVNTMVARAPEQPDGNALVAAVKAANMAIIRAAEDGTGKPGMGTTMTAAQVFGDKVFIAQVGDSRAYLLHDGNLQRITRDHSLVADLVEKGRITEEEARFHPRRSVITRALGSDPQTEPDLYVIRVEKGDRLLLCSDGLSGMVYDETIAAVLAKAATPYDACQMLIREALAAGGSDNVTTVVIDPLRPGITESEKAPKRKRRFLAPIIWAIAFIAVIAAFCGAVIWLENNSFYIAVDQSTQEVCVYKGWHDKILGKIELNEEIYDNGLTFEQLPQDIQQKLDKGKCISGDDLDTKSACEQRLDQWKAQATESADESASKKK